MRRLPLPDKFGNYWLNRERDGKQAIFPLTGFPRIKGKYMAVTQREGALFDGNKLRAFDSAQDALEEILRIDGHAGAA